MAMKEYKPVNHLMCADENPDTLQPTSDVQFIYPRYPNYDFLQIEEINQVIYNFTKHGFTSTSCIYTSKIKDFLPKTHNDKVFVKNIHNLRYNFTLVSMVMKNNQNYWTFEVHNTLWSGEWYLQNEDGTPYTGSYNATSPDITGHTFTIHGKNLQNFRLCLKLTNDNIPRHIDVNCYSFIGNYEYTQQYDENKSEIATLVNKKDNTFVENAIVKLIPLDNSSNEITNNNYTNYIQPNTAINKKKGKYSVKYSAVPVVGTYYARLEAYIDDELVAHTNVIIHKVQNYSRTISLDSTNLKMYKGEIKTFKGKINITNKYGYTNNNKINQEFVVNIYHTFNIHHKNPLDQSLKYKEATHVISTTADEEGNFSFDINSRGNYVDTSTIKIVLPKTANYSAVTSQSYTITHEWFYAKDYPSLKNECEREKGADAIVLYNKTYNRTKSSQTIHINRIEGHKQYILGKSGSGWATLNNNRYGECFHIDNPNNNESYNQLILKGIQITDAECAIKQENNTMLNAVSCVFRYNLNPETDYQGGVVYQKGIDCVTDISYSFFENNYANCIIGKGIVELNHNLFKITQVKYTHQPQPFVLKQYSGRGTLKNNQFYINTSLSWDSKGKPKVSAFNRNRSYAKIAIEVGKTATVNGKKSNQLHSNNSMNYFDKPYNNRGYIFSAYWYPYDNVHAYIVASSSNKNINKATGHSTWDVDWAYRDGYYLVRESWKNYNTYNPFVKFKNGNKIVDPKITVPSAGGVL